MLSHILAAADCVKMTKSYLYQTAGAPQQKHTCAKSNTTSTMPVNSKQHLMADKARSPGVKEKPGNMESCDK